MRVAGTAAILFRHEKAGVTGGGKVEDVGGEHISKYRNWWRPDIERYIKQYPTLVAQKRELQKQSITASISGMPRNGEASRTTEVSALKTLSPQEEKIIDAVEMAIKEIGKQRDGAEVLKIVEMVEFSKQYTLDGAAMKLYMHRNTASSRLGRFIDAVGRYMGF